MARGGNGPRGPGEVIELATAKGSKKRAHNTNDGASYTIHDGAFHRVGENTYQRLCNFTARIVAEEVHDDGEATDTHFVIEGRLEDGAALPAVTVPAASFSGLAWIVSAWGARPILKAGNSIKDHVRCAIQTLSPSPERITVYTHLGWRCVDGEWVYLSGSGAIGIDGLREDLRVDPGRGNMGRYALPAPPAGPVLTTSVRATLQLLELAPAHPAVGAVALACIFRAPIAVPVDFSLFVSGLYQAYKSELAALMLAHFGDFTARSFPANWSDTASDLEAKAYAAKDAPFVIDDFKPSGGTVEVNRLHAKADAVFRGVGNQAGRGRRGPGMEAQRTFYPRGLVVATGEDTPRGGSVKARMVVLNLSRGAIDRHRLTQMQDHARAGLFAATMSGFLRWLAQQLPDLHRDLPGRQLALREKMIERGLPPDRSASQAASLWLGLELFMRFARESGAVGDAEADEILERCGVALRGLFDSQREAQHDADETLQFLRLLRAALLSGRCHLSDPVNQGPPVKHPHFCGWRNIAGSASADDEKTSSQAAVQGPRPQGVRIGWAPALQDEVWLEGESTYSVVQALAREQGEHLAIGKYRLWQNLRERDFLAQVDGDRNSVVKQAAGVRVRLYVMPRQHLEGAADS
ncbi:hypothetical protein ACW73L_21495 [Methylolobus aquaticus]